MRFAQNILTLVLFLLLASATSLALRHLVAQVPQISAAQTQAREALYLPSGKGLQALSFGYENVLADVLWFNTINYFGKHHRSDQNYRWLAHMCNLVSDLNPRALHVYDFCGTMLAWEANSAQASVDLFSKAIAQFPDEWKLYYQRGFAYMFFLKDTERAQADFLKSATLPGAHSLVKRLAAKRLAASESADAAIEFLTDLLQGEKDPAEKSALESRLREAYYERDFQLLERARDMYKQKTGQFPARLQDLADSGILQSEFKDPFGGSYVIDPNSGEIASTSKHKRISSFR